MPVRRRRRCALYFGSSQYPGEVLVFSREGYETRKIEVQGQKTLNVTLLPRI